MGHNLVDGITSFPLHGGSFAHAERMVERDHLHQICLRSALNDRDATLYLPVM